MNSSASDQPTSEKSAPVLSDSETTTPAENAAVHPDPITGEPGAHPVGVGVGALGAGAAGAAIGALAGPLGMVVGAVIGAVAGGLAGKEVATTPEETALVEEAALDKEGSTTIGDEPNDSTAFSSSAAPEPDLVAASFMATPAEVAGLVAPSPSTRVSEETPASDSDTTAISSWPDDDKAAYQVGSDAQPATPELSHSSFSTDDGAIMEHTVRTAAYFRFLDRMHSGTPGDETSDWVEAEKTTAAKP